MTATTIDYRQTFQRLGSRHPETGRKIEKCPKCGERGEINRATGHCIHRMHRGPFAWHVDEHCSWNPSELNSVA